MWSKKLIDLDNNSYIIVFEESDLKFIFVSYQNYVIYFFSFTWFTQVVMDLTHHKFEGWHPLVITFRGIGKVEISTRALSCYHISIPVMESSRKSQSLWEATELDPEYLPNPDPELATVNIRRRWVNTIGVYSVL